MIVCVMDKRVRGEPSLGKTTNFFITSLGILKKNQYIITIISRVIIYAKIYQKSREKYEKK